jgi:hypothetical protein
MKMANTPEFQRFIDEHKSELSTKEKKKFWIKNILDQSIVLCDCIAWRHENSSPHI